MNINDLKIGMQVEYTLKDTFVGIVKEIQTNEVIIKIIGVYPGQGATRGSFDEWQVPISHPVKFSELNKMSFAKESLTLGDFTIGDRIRYAETDKYYYLGEVFEVTPDRINFTLEARYLKETNETVYVFDNKKHHVTKETLNRLSLYEETLETNLTDKDKQELKDIFTNLCILTKDEDWFASLGNGEWEQELTEA